MKKKMTLGFILSIIVAVLSLAACIAYTQVMYTMTAVYILLVAVILLVCVAKFVKQFPAEILPVLNAFLIGSAAAWGAKNMVNQLGYVVSGLDTVDTIITFIVFEVFAILALILNIVAGFMRQTKSPEDAKVVTE